MNNLYLNQVQAGSNSSLATSVKASKKTTKIPNKGAQEIGTRVTEVMVALEGLNLQDKKRVLQAALAAMNLEVDVTVKGDKGKATGKSGTKPSPANDDKSKAKKSRGVPTPWTEAEKADSLCQEISQEISGVKSRISKKEVDEDEGGKTLANLQLKLAEARLNVSTSSKN
jgi:hypothetical protein